MQDLNTVVQTVSLTSLILTSARNMVLHDISLSTQSVPIATPKTLMTHSDSTCAQSKSQKNRHFLKEIDAEFPLTT